ncbi:MAG: Transaldolase [Chroococcidiopsis cubana SAG 39.79]|jgi:transaldolase|uniref:Transaldolase n=2 Tax=Chroococcidiopsis TaxID=54298 RepID=K9TU16_CHRTP|nr:MULTISPECIES: transaldolase [Chroococcidiopsis]PSB43717.1 transaldolase [Cyanosarcina cf. burmensis CCALA 770]AFY86302.1 transaldolase [Chroococcidiopsis thermalis PCC 7203]MDZ4873552.1 Transaldolase [Chroococcidiopsis cubana SAG 39.79]PSB62327.1 transaldolase [Chroococcidiopsis cubana CCALA 043]RUT11735.1 transaldolase [Chroococcidiopsis cubana SAG 39.79]
MATNHLLEIKEYGQSIWMDNLTRDLVQSGELKNLVENQGICGITSNPAIFEKAIAGNAIYDADIEAGIRAGLPTYKIYESLVFKDIRDACDILRPVYDASGGLDGYVSIEVPPTIAHDTQATINEARRYYQEIGRDNVMIKIPGTDAGLPAVEQVISEGINVNVTLLFSVQSYIETAWAYIRGLEKRAAEGKDISKISSVASFFLSRIDSNIDGKIDDALKAGVDRIEKEAKLRAVKGKVAIANAKIAYQEYKKIIQSDRWQALAAKGANVQRLLWASTSTKDPNYSDVMYVDELIGPETVNTLPPNTIDACADHCDVANRVESNVEEAYKLIENLKDPDVAIDIDQVMDELLVEGIDKFIKPFESLMQSLEEKVAKLSPV